MIFRVILIQIFLLTATSTKLYSQKTYVLIQSSPGVEVYIDTTLQGVTSPGKGELKVEGLMQGKYEMTFKNNGKSLRKTIQIEDANERILFVDLANGMTEDRSPVNRASKYALLEYKHPEIWYEAFEDPRDGRIYRYCRIGQDDWMAENLNYTMWGKSYVYPRDTLHVHVYGKLYTWQDACKACPPGWHLPTDKEWTDMEKFLGISDSIIVSRGWRKTLNNASIKSMSGWLASAPSGDELGFRAFPGGFRDSDGLFFNEGYFAYFWTASESDEDAAWYRVVTHDLNHVGRFSYDKQYSFSIRCVKNRN